MAAHGVIIVLLCILGLTRCGGGTTTTIVPPPPSVSVTISPATQNVASGATLQFSAQVAHSTNQSVTWQVNQTVGGSPALGTISEGGLYTSPGMLFTPMTITVTAISKADSTKSASATVNILSAHRIGVRVTNGAGEFFDRSTGNTFTPRGNNYIRLAQQQNSSGQPTLYHSTFNVGLYDAAKSEAVLSQMQSNGYNVVRVFVNGCCQGGVGNPAGGLSTAYLANFADFLSKAKAHNIFVIPTQDEVPQIGGYMELMNGACCSTFAGVNTDYLAQGGIDANNKFFGDLAQGLVAQGATVDAILAYELRNELYFESSLPPLTLSSGTITTANSQTYDLSDPAARQRMMDENLAYWTAQGRSALLKHDPSALVTVGFFWPQQPNPTRIGDTRVIQPYPGIANSTADFADLHLYPGLDLTLAQYVQNYGFSSYLEKPVIMGEFGAFTWSYGTPASAATALKLLQSGSCQYAFKGWLLWTWDSDEQPELWNALSVSADINQALAPVNRPDPCID